MSLGGEDDVSLQGFLHHGRGCGARLVGVECCDSSPFDGTDNIQKDLNLNEDSTHFKTFQFNIMKPINRHNRGYFCCFPLLIVLFCILFYSHTHSPNPMAKEVVGVTWG